MVWASGTLQRTITLGGMLRPCSDCGVATTTKPMMKNGYGQYLMRILRDTVY